MPFIRSARNRERSCNSSERVYTPFDLETSPTKPGRGEEYPCHLEEDFFGSLLRGQVL